MDSKTSTVVWFFVSFSVSFQNETKQPFNSNRGAKETPHCESTVFFLLLVDVSPQIWNDAWVNLKGAPTCPVLLLPRSSHLSAPTQGDERRWSWGAYRTFWWDVFSSQTELSFSSHLFPFISLRFFSSLNLVKFQQRRQDLSGTNRLFFPSFLIFSCTFFHTDFKSRCNLSLPNRSRSVDLAVVSKKKKTSII